MAKYPNVTKTKILNVCTTQFDKQVCTAASKSKKEYKYYGKYSVHVHVFTVENCWIEETYSKEEKEME